MVVGAIIVMKLVGCLRYSLDGLAEYGRGSLERGFGSPDVDADDVHASEEHSGGLAGMLGDPLGVDEERRRWCCGSSSGLLLLVVVGGGGDKVAWR